MAERFHNPFQSLDIFAPTEFREEYARYCQTGGGEGISVSRRPFPRMVDMWFLAFCIAVRLGLKPADLRDADVYKIIDGAILSSDPWRINVLLLVGIDYFDNVDVVMEPSKILAVASGLSAAGVPTVIEYLKAGQDEPLWNLTDSLEEVLA